jgi:hypothetical protein
MEMIMTNKFEVNMKSRFKVFIVLVFGICTIYSSDASDTKDVAFLFKTNGKIQIQKANSRSWTNASRGSRLSSGDKIQTGDRSLAALYFTDDKSLMKVRSRSNITIQGERKQKTISKRVFMAVGQVFVNVKKRNSVFRLETPTGVAAVKGTQFYGKYEDGMFTVSVIEGIVELINQYGSILVNAGQTGISEENSEPSSRDTQDGDFDPDLGEGGDGQEDALEIEFEKQETGDKKTVQIILKSKGNQ